MKLCVIASNYPTENNHVHIFLDNIVTEFVDRGIKCDVIAPQSLFAVLFKRKRSRKRMSERKTKIETPFFVYSPIYLVFPKRRLFGINFADLTKKSYIQAVFREYKKRKIVADATYSHFFQAGIAGVKLAKSMNIPSFIANGECDTVDSLKHLRSALIESTLNDVTGIISVSTKNKEEVISICGENSAISEKIIVIPNGIEESRFCQKDRILCRKTLGFPEDKFIVSFTGSFIERKGVNRLSNVLNKLDNIYSVFIGQGRLLPACRNILFCGRLQNARICDYLNATDIFVLPTLAEGCSNAIIEALACGLPVVSSDLPFNDDILDDTCSIKVDPMNEQEILWAIKYLRDNPDERERLSCGSLVKADSLKLHNRVDRIIDFIKDKSVECNTMAANNRNLYEYPNIAH